MERKDYSNFSSIGFVCIRAFVIFIAFYAIKSLTLLTIMIASLNAKEDLQYLLIPSLLAMPFILNSIFYVTTVYNRYEMNEFLAEAKERPAFIEECRKTLKKSAFWIEISVISALICTVSFFGGFSEFSRVFFFDAEPTAFQLRVIPLLILVPFVFVISIHRYYSARLYWWQLSRRDELDKIYSTPKLVMRIVFIVLGYPIIFPGVTFILAGILTLINIFFTLVNVFTVLGFVLAVVLIFGIIFGSLLLGAVRARKKFLKRLAAVLSDSEFEISEIKNPYRSLFKEFKEANFTLKKGDKVYACRLLGSWWQRAPMHFISDKHCLYLHKVGTKSHFVSFERHLTYDFPAEEKKILIVCPVPKFIYASAADVDSIVTEGDLGLHPKAKQARRLSRQLEPGDTIWGYTVYNTSSFVNAIERDCLARQAGLFE